jgi:hypothetical protein
MMSPKPLLIMLSAGLNLGLNGTLPIAPSSVAPTGCEFWQIETVQSKESD